MDVHGTASIGRDARARRRDGSGYADRDRILDEADPCTDSDGLGNPGFPANLCPEDNCPDVANGDQADQSGASPSLRRSAFHAAPVLAVCLGGRTRPPTPALPGGLMMAHSWMVVAFLCGVPLLAAACAPERPDAELDGVAEEYVRLVLAVGRHDDNYVDAYYGPTEWREEAGAGEPVPLPELLDRARALLERVRAAGATDRRDFLEAQLVAVEAFLRRLDGEPMTLSQEARLLYDFDPPVHEPEAFEAARARLESLLPGDAPLADRVQALRDRFMIPRDRLEAVVASCLEATREITREKVKLPGGESFQVSFVQDKPWSAYNWYQGKFASLIEVNTDLPIELASNLHTIAHEGYPGHHTYNALLEDRLVQGRGWQEYSVYPLYSPQSLLAEGTANAGLSVLMSEDQAWIFLEDVLAAEAGLKGADFATYRAARETLRSLRYVRGEGARMLLDEARPDDEVVAFLRRYGLMSEARARKALDFFRTYRSYVFNYTAGEDLVRAYIGSGPDRGERFFDLLQRPATPSALLREVEGG